MREYNLNFLGGVIAMSYASLADFLEELRQSGQLVRVEAKVSADLEAAEITSRVAQQGGPALLFGDVEGHDFPLLTNLLATDQRICRALGIRSPEDLEARIAELAQPSEPEGWFEKLKAAPTRAALRKLAPKAVKSGPCQQIVRLGGDVDLGQLPAVRARPLEPAPRITAGQVVTVDASSNRPLLGHYDLGLVDRCRLAVGWMAHDEPARALSVYRQRGIKMPLAVVLGGDPAGLLAAMAPVPPDLDGSSLAGLLRDKPREMVRCRTIDLEVPADADLVLEGHIDPAGPEVEFGLAAAPGGPYRRSRPAPVMEVTSISHRANPVFAALVPGQPPDESCVIRRFLQRVFTPLVRLAVPDLVGYDLPLFGAARGWAVVSIRKVYAGQARRAAHAVWGLPQLMFAKLLVIVDEEVDVHDYPQVWAAVWRHVDPGRDLMLGQGPPDPWDSAAEDGELTTRLCLDATAKLPGERAAAGPPSAMPKEILRRVTDRWPELGLGGL
jgi:4-hydroxy-3-polyprenylbenzoate decarboxylase